MHPMNTLERSPHVVTAPDSNRGNLIDNSVVNRRLTWSTIASYEEGLKRMQCSKNRLISV